MLQRFLDPKTLSAISSLDLVARTVVDGFVAGLHRSPDFGFSQEFAEYQAYTPGDDLRHVDWNVFAKSEKLVLKRYRGETNSQLLVLLDTSASMAFGANTTKIDYARFLAASLVYMGNLQRDATGVIVFDDDVNTYVPPSSRQGQLHRLLHAIEHSVPGIHTDFAKPFLHFQNFLHRRGIVAVISDFYEQPETIVKAIEPLRFHGNEVILFHVLDPQEIEPKFRDSTLLLDMETKSSLEVSPEYAKTEYRQKMANHITTLRDRSKAAGLDYFLINTSRPLDEALREYLTLRQRRD
ncbi:MAG: hypothetical protein JWO80_1307 [Bryobacterales bacterium]|nr:hypothetical protein [Bryobacterales bacterium]